MNTNELRELLVGLPVPDVRYHEVAGSTNDLAMQWVGDHQAADGCLVVADQQVKGRGRLGRSWVTRPGVALAFSLVLRPSPEEIDRLALLSPAAAVAVSTAVQAAIGLDAQIKWPNDVLIKRRKVCGILAEANWIPEGQAVVVLGIGINVSQGSLPPAEGLLFPATCLEDETGSPVERWPLLRATLAAFFDLRPKIGTAGFMGDWSQRLAFINEPVMVQELDGKSYNGRMVGVSSGGDLRLQLENGQEMQFSAGDVHLRPADA